MRLLYVFFICFLSLSMSAQSFELNKVNEELAEGESLSYGVITLTNTSEEDIEVALTLVPKCLLESDTVAISVCFSVFCFADTQEETTWGTAGIALLTIPAGGTIDNVLKFEPIDVSDAESRWEVVFFDRNNPSDLAALNVTIKDEGFTACATSIEDVEVADLSQAYPNPAHTSVTVSVENARRNGIFTIINATGQIVEEFQISDNTTNVSIDVINYESGIYYYYLRGESGGISSAKSFIKE